jgi:ribonuclease PH
MQPLGAQRKDGRKPDEIRPVAIRRGFTEFAPGSVLIELGKTRILCTAMVTDGVPPFLLGTGQGWLTAEYSMLPSATPGPRKMRDGRGPKPDGRSVEIQRLVGRALRTIVDLKAMPDRTVWIDCDVLQADGGTRVAAITGSYVALYDAMLDLDHQRSLRRWPILTQVAAISVGLVGGNPVVDLAYAEDSTADVDMNVVMTGAGEYVEVQGTAEKKPFARPQFDAMLDLARKGIDRLFEAQASALGLAR